MRLDGHEPAAERVKVNSGGRHRVELSLNPLPGELEITSSPEGATIMIDGRRQDEETTTPATVRLDPGEHIVELRLEGYESLSQEISIDPGGQQEIVVELIPEPVPEPPPEDAAIAEPQPREVLPGESPTQEPSRRWRGWPWVVLGTGLALGATGGVLDIVSLVESRRTEPTQSMDDYQHWQNVVRNTALAGDILLWTGVAVTVGGLIWLLLSRRRDRRIESSTSGAEDQSVLPSEMLAFRPDTL